MIGSKVIKPQDGYIPVELAYIDYLTGIYHPDFTKEVFKALCSHLTSNRKLFDEIILDEVPEESPLLSEFHVGPCKSEWRVVKNKDSICPVIQFPDSWDDLLNQLSSNARYQIRRDLRKVTKDHIFEVKTAQTRSEVEYAFQKLVDFHQARWNELGQLGIFTDQRVLFFSGKPHFAFMKKAGFL